jgi:ferric-dicitrate binding protein FerR (iron transport regulator)
MIVGKERYARLAAQLLIQQRPEDASVRADLRRDAVVAAMALAIAAKARRRRIATGTVVALAAAASVVVAVKFMSNGGSSVTERTSASALVVEREIGQGNWLLRAGSTEPLSNLAVLAVGDSIRSDKESSATLAFQNGTRVALASASALRVDELGATRRLSLLAGHLDAHVAKLVPGERFIVNTPDSEVEVRGTVFSVDVETAPPGCRGSGVTATVRVREGEVSVRSRDNRVLIHPGETWTLPCAETESSITPDTASGEPSAAPVSARNVRLRARPAFARTARAASRTGQAASAPSAAPLAAASAPSMPVAVPGLPSQLGQQNDLMSAAMAAERQGQHDLALRKLNQLIERFPSGPLGESARAERQRILSAPTPR